jgi:catechol 1,2-dioxygenase
MQTNAIAFLAPPNGKKKQNAPNILKDYPPKCFVISEIPPPAATRMPLEHARVSNEFVRTETTSTLLDDLIKDAIMPEYTSQQLLEIVNQSDRVGGNPRVKQITRRIVTDIFQAIEDLDIHSEEFWTGVRWLNELGRTGEFGMVTAGLGFDRLLDIRLDESDDRAGLALGTPRAIEGPLFIPNAPLCEGEARLDDGTAEGELMVMEGRVTDLQDRPVKGTIVHVWHANPEGLYSHFDPTQSEFNFRRRIKTDDKGWYRFRSLMPSGYGAPLGSPTAKLLDLLGRHGYRPAHVHLMVEAPEHRLLTTQINIAGDTYIDDDAAFATRDGLIVDVVKVENPQEIARRKLEGAFSLIRFDIKIQPKSPCALAVG